MGVEIVPLHTLAGIGREAATLECVYTGREREIACGTVVIVTMRPPSGASCPHRATTDAQESGR